MGAWRVLERWDKPFLCAFSDNDPTFRGVDKEFQQRVPGAWKTDHVTIKGGGHFLQEDKPQELAEAVLDFLAGRLHNPNGSKPKKRSAWAWKCAFGTLLVALCFS